VIGIGIIGRNEGQRLVRCLESVDKVKHIVYVDSCSTDESVAMARSLGVDVVELDMSVPFTAARARNNGFRRLKEILPSIKYVQFIDGDCELIDGWLDEAQAALQECNEAAVVCGRLKERNPDASVYNLLCDIEWDAPAGVVNECGGIFMMKADVFDQLGGFADALIAGEEPELCVRVRQSGYFIHRLAIDMAWHDANMTHFSQWWKRAVRSGHAYAEGAWMHGSSPQQHWVREVRRNWFWGLSVPLLVAAVAILPSMTPLLLIYPLQMFRIYHHSNLRRSNRSRRIFAFFCVLANLPMMFGQMKFHWNRLIGNQSRIIEYK